MAIALLPLCFLFFVAVLPLPFFAEAQRNNGSVLVGASLSTGDAPWLSPSRDFAFGFLQIDGPAYLLAIWYNKIPENTTVWYANPDNPTVSRGAKVDLTPDKGLVLRIPGNNNPTTISQLSPNGSRAASGFLNDTGNFVIRNSGSGVLWESFKHPTNTLLPGQVLPKDGLLFSQRSETNFSRGRFELRMQPDGNLVGYTVNFETRYQYFPYYSSSTYDTSSPSNSGDQLEFNATTLFVAIRNGTESVLSNQMVNSVEDYYHRVTLNFDGVISQYRHFKNSNSGDGWMQVWYVPDNMCLKIDLTGKGGGPCGFNSICKLGEDKRPTCQCPKGFSLLDPNYTFGGCKPDFVQDCEWENGGADGFELVELPRVNFPGRDVEQLKPINKEEECRKACLSDCLCGVAIFNGESCYKKSLPVANGVNDTSLTTTKALIKIRRDRPPPTVPGASPGTGKTKDRGQLILVGSVLFGTSLFVNFLLILALCTGFFFIHHKKLRANITKSDDIPDTNLRCFAYQELVDATDGFKEELGRGSFGVVYKGVLRQMGSGSPVVAVKKLDRVTPQESEKEFMAEVNSIGQTHHKNLVRLLGFCNQGSQRLLVYEFLSNGSLAGFLFCDSKPSWTRRMQIPVGIARGLVYLHEECSRPIIHCDIKAQNILLDDDFNPRISDFGLAKLLMMNKSHTQTGIRGTKGYVAPEWFRSAQVTAKVDVYSFGVVLLEIVCSRRIWDVEINGQNGVLIDWAYDCYREGILDTLVESDEEAMNDGRKLERFVKVGLWCIQEDPSLRPTMKKVIQMLEGVVQVPVPPNPFPFGGSSVWNDEGDH